MSDPDSYPYKPCKNINNNNSLNCLINNNNSGCCKNTDESTTLPYQPYSNQDNQCYCAPGTILTTCPIQQVDNGIAYNDSSSIKASITLRDYDNDSVVVAKLGVAFMDPGVETKTGDHTLRIGYSPNGGIKIEQQPDSDTGGDGTPRSCQIPCYESLEKFEFLPSFSSKQIYDKHCISSSDSDEKYLPGKIQEKSAVYDKDNNLSCIIPICVSDYEFEFSIQNSTQNPITGIPTFS